jgi:hypothetical protein
MSDSIDDLVVFAEFDNKAFNSKIAESLKALEDFEKGLEMKDATKGSGRHRCRSRQPGLLGRGGQHRWHQQGARLGQLPGHR